MGYSTSPKTINGVRQYLDQMLAADGNVTWSAENPSALAFRLREAMWAVRQVEGFEKYRSLKTNFTIREGEDYVLAERRKGYPTVPVRVEGAERKERERRRSTSTRTINDPIKLLDVLGAATPWPDGVRELYFPNANLLEPEMERLNRWARESELEVISHEGAGVTIRSP